MAFADGIQYDLLAPLPDGDMVQFSVSATNASVMYPHCTAAQVLSLSSTPLLVAYLKLNIAPLRRIFAWCVWSLQCTELRKNLEQNIEAPRNHEWCAPPQRVGDNNVCATPHASVQRVQHALCGSWCSREMVETPSISASGVGRYKIVPEP